MSSTASNLLSVQLSTNGKVSNAAISRIEVEKSINKIAMATIVIQDGSKAKEDFELSDSSDFNPGNTVEIKAGYHSKEKTIFKGIIIGQTISIDTELGPSLRIECKDVAFTTTHGHKNNYFLDKTDSEIINNILGNYGLSKSIDSTSVTHEEIIQYGTTDWDFILSRANLNGLVVVTDDGEMLIKKPDVSSNPVHTLTYGDDIIELDLTLGSENQLQSVNAVSWDASIQNRIQGKSKEPSVNQQGNITGKKLAEVSNTDALLQTIAPLEKEALDSWANAQLLQSRLSRFQGIILSDGNADIKPNTLVEIKGIGKKFNGNAFVSSVFHELYEGSWLTNITIGLDTIETAVTSDRVPAMSGLQIGIVKKIHDDPAEEFRILVTLPLINGSDDGIWARLGNFFASNGSGSFFYPEVGDEVILGFLDGNPSAPIILGSIYSKKNAPTVTPDEKNSTKAIISKSGIQLIFDDEQKVFTIVTPGNNKIVLDDKNKNISIKDMNDNSIVMDDSGITVKTPKDISLNAEGNINLTATSNLAMKATADATLDGLSITQNAKTSFTANGNASAELSASGQTTVKGAMVMIN